jgi:hypothetical protein
MGCRIITACCGLNSIENYKLDISVSRLVKIAEVLEINPAFLVNDITSQYFIFNNC